MCVSATNIQVIQTASVGKLIFISDTKVGGSPMGEGRDVNPVTIVFPEGVEA